MSIITGVLAAAALFALFGLLRPARGCDADCAACGAACHRKESGHAEP